MRNIAPTNLPQDIDDKEAENKTLDGDELDGKKRHSKSIEGQKEINSATPRFRPILFNNVSLPSTGGNVQGLYKDYLLRLLSPCDSIKPFYIRYVVHLF